jgi:hypothetical protein
VEISNSSFVSITSSATTAVIFSDAGEFPKSTIIVKLDESTFSGIVIERRS